MKGKKDCLDAKVERAPAIYLLGCSTSNSSSSEDGEATEEETEDLDAQIEYLCEKGDLLLRATRILREEEIYNASIAQELIKAEKCLEDEEPQVNPNDDYDDDDDGDSDECDNIWKQAKEIIDILNQRGDTGGRPPLSKKRQKRKVRFEENESGKNKSGRGKRSKMSKYIDTSRVTSVPALSFKVSKNSVSTLEDGTNRGLVANGDLVGVSSAHNVVEIADILQPVEEFSTANWLSSESESSRKENGLGLPSELNGVRRTASLRDASFKTEYPLLCPPGDMFASSQQKRRLHQSQSLENILSNHTYVCDKEGTWMISALRQQALPAAPEGWGLYSDSVTVGRCLIPPLSSVHNSVTLVEAIALSSKPQ